MNLFYKKTKERRQLLGISQEELAEISGVGLRTIKQIETNKANPSLKTLTKLLDVLGLELELKLKNQDKL